MLAAASAALLLSFAQAAAAPVAADAIEVGATHFLAVDTRSAAPAGAVAELAGRHGDARAR